MAQWRRGVAWGDAISETDLDALNPGLQILDKLARATAHRQAWLHDVADRKGQKARILDPEHVQWWETRWLQGRMHAQYHFTNKEILWLHRRERLAGR